MRELYEEGKPFTAVVNGKPYLSTAVKKTGVKPVFRLKTQEGYELRLTADHKVVTFEGPIAAEKLIKGDQIMLTSGGGFGSVGSLEEGQVLGWLVGDGSMKKENLHRNLHRWFRNWWQENKWSHALILWLHNMLKKKIRR